MPRLAVAERRRELVIAAIRVIATHGVTAATTRAIAAEAGMPLASLHYAFQSRDELLEAVIEQVTRDEADTALATLLPTGEEVAAEPATLEQVLVTGLDTFLDLLVADPLREQALLELSNYALRTPGLAETAQRQHEAYYRTAEIALTAAANATGSTWILPLPDVCRFLVTVTDGITTTWLADRDTEASRATLRIAAAAIARLGRPAGQGAEPLGAAAPGASARPSLLANVVQA